MGVNQFLNFRCSSPNDDCQMGFSRKKRRGIIEKRRRDRINSSLLELRRLVPTAFEKQGSAKLEKAEILQMTVDHLKTIHSKGKGSPSSRSICLSTSAVKVNYYYFFLRFGRLGLRPSQSGHGLQRDRFQRMRERSGEVPEHRGRDGHTEPFEDTSHVPPSVLRDPKGIGVETSFHPLELQRLFHPRLSRFQRLRGLSRSAPPKLGRTSRPRSSASLGASPSPTSDGQDVRRLAPTGRKVGVSVFRSGPRPQAPRNRKSQPRGNLQANPSIQLSNSRALSPGLRATGIQSFGTSQALQAVGR